MSKQSESEIEQHKRTMLTDRLAQCSQPQRDLFARIYPDGVPERDLVSAIDLCDRAIRKNLENPSRLITSPEGGKED